MFSVCLESLGLGLSVIGTLLVMMSCGLPMWKVSAYIEANIVVAQNIWDGLWMSCVVQSTGQMQCKLHESVLGLSTDLQTARSLTVLASVTGVLGLLVTVAGAQCTNCISDEALKARVVTAGGVIYMLSGVFVLVPLCWMANNIVANFHNPQVSVGNKREIGASIYIGFAAVVLLLLGGALLCRSSPRGGSAYVVKYPPPKSLTDNGVYDKKNYV